MSLGSNSALPDTNTAKSRPQERPARGTATAENPRSQLIQSGRTGGQIEGSQIKCSNLPASVLPIPLSWISQSYAGPSE